MGCWEHPTALRECATTQHSDSTSYHGLIISVFAGNGKAGNGDGLCVRIDFFKAVLGNFNSAPLFMFPAGRGGRGVPAPGRSVGNHK